jgi:hypothetical protein
VIALLTAIWAFVGAPRPWQVASEISASTVTLSNTEIILDASAKTAAPFGGETKLQASQGAIAQFVLPLSNEGIALRRAGGGCDEAGELVVDFGADHGDEVREEAMSQRPEGKSNIANAVRAAIDEFKDSDFKAPNTTERIFILMNGEDECGGDAKEIRDALDGSDVDADFTVVALGPSRAERKRLMSFKRVLASYADVEVRTPVTKEQLEDVVKHEVRKAVEIASTASQDATSSSGSGDGESTGTSGSDGDEASDGASDSSSGATDRQTNKRRESRHSRRNPGEKDSAEKDCAATQETEPKETVPRGTEAEAGGAETAPSEADQAEEECAEENPPKEDSAGTGADDLSPQAKEKDETTPDSTVPSEAEPPREPSTGPESTTSSTGVGLRLPFGGTWMLSWRRLVWPA